jgi:uncharacterized lipoprotein YbaY/heat shock protein HslJ
MPKLSLVLTLLVLSICALMPAAAQTLHGTALLRERIALPDALVFEAVIADTARADAPATPLASTRFETSGQPPFAFAIPYDPAALDPHARYTLRATLHRNGRLFATTDQVVPVLEGGAPTEFELVLRLVSDRPEPSRPLPAHGLRLPASFRGTLPCADCAGIRHHLDLWPDQVYALRREWLGGTDGDRIRDEMGRWHADPGRGAIVLQGASEMPLFWQVMAPDRLRQMDMQGAPIASALDYDLRAEGGFAPIDLAGLFVSGEALVGPDGPALRDCLTGRVFAVDPGGEFPALAAAVAAARTSHGLPLLVNVTARIAQPPQGLAPQFPRLTVLGLNGVFPGESCTRPEPVAALTETYWRIVEMQGRPVPHPPDTREPHLILRAGEPPRFAATVGCNRLLGGYALDGTALRFTAAASTLMACPPPLDAAEHALRAVLEGTRAIRAEGQRLSLLDEGGAVLARLAAVYLR